MGKLSSKQERFIEEYLIDLNATQAAIRAGYSTKYADRQAHILMINGRISSAISVAKAERSKRTGITADRVLEELAKVGFANLTDIVTLDEAAVKRGSHADDTAAIQSIKVKRITTEEGDNIVEREVKLHDKIKALDLIARHLGLYNDKLRLDGALQINFFEGELKD